VLRRVRERALEAYEHQDLPFQKLVAALEPERSLSHSPVFQAMFVLKEAQGGLGLPGVSARAEEIGSGTAKFDLMLSLQEAGRQIRGWIEYATELFEAETIRRMVGHYETLLTSAVRDPDQRISILPLLSEAERRRILVDWGAAKAEYSADTLIHESFEAQAALRPESVAVVCGERRLTYHELNVRANQLARYLRNLGVGSEALVGLCAEPSLEMIVGLVGVLKAGGAYVPLDPSYPRERLALMLEDTQSALILTQRALVDNLPPHKARVICLDSDWEAIKQEGTTDIESGVAPSNLAYVIYTSGSTGRPKGVLITHHNVFRLFKATHARFGFDENDVWTLFHSYSFDFSVWEIWGALFYGGRLVVVPGWMRRSPEAFHALLCREQVTVLGQTPSAFRQLNNADASAESARSLALRLIIFGGEAIDLQDIKSWFARHGDQTPRLVNMYGITETTVHSTYRFLTEEDVAATSGTPIGVPLPDTEVYVLGGHRQPVPVGVPGELYVGGPSLARGYLNRPDLTAERFIPNPFSNRLEARLYKSGDLVRYQPDGDIEYLGRIDQQVKIRGYRIEVGEIEAVLREHPAVTATVVVLREDAPGDKRLVAYIVPKQGESLTVVQLRGILGRRLPEYMLPSRFEFLRSLAVTPSGKVDRRALPTPGESRPEVGNPFEAPRTDLEERLAKIWREVLCLDQVGIHDNFFHLGGNSLLATRVVSAARKEFGSAVSLRRFFEMSTLAGLAVGVVESLAEEVGQAESQHFLDELEAPAPGS
jgi:amino acid adenylation domain-containing protein